MTVLNKLASVNGIRNTEPNKELAQELVSSKNIKAIQELIDNLKNKNKNIQSDCIKVLYEIGEQKPELIAPYDAEFLQLLHHKNNRLVWGAMAALDCIASINPKKIYKNLGIILEIAGKGSVITKDHGVGILTKLSKEKAFADTALVLLLDLMKTAAANQLPKYAENALPVITETSKKDFVKILTNRLEDFDKESKKNRLQNVIKKLSV